jgi:hypothetical protein
MTTGFADERCSIATADKWIWIVVEESMPETDERNTRDQGCKEGAGRETV